MAFQPIVDTRTGTPFAYEALVRGPGGEPAGTILSKVSQENLYAFDQSCRVQAITLASRLGLQSTGASLSINFLPGAVYSPSACIQLTLKTAREVGFPTNRLIFEVTEGEKVRDPAHLQSIADEYQRQGFKVAIDDFGAGFANLNLLANLSTDIIKLDMELIRNLQNRRKSERLVRGMTEICGDLGIRIIAEGIETVEEYEQLQHCGIHLMQGYLLAKPAFERLPDFTLPGTRQSNVPSQANANSFVMPTLAYS